MQIDTIVLRTYVLSENTTLQFILESRFEGLDFPVSTYFVKLIIKKYSY